MSAHTNFRLEQGADLYATDHRGLGAVAHARSLVITRGSRGGGE